MASRPIFSLEFENMTRRAQFTLGGYLRWGLRNFMAPNTGVVMFKINGRHFVFKNGSLMEENLSNVIELGLPDIAVAQRTDTFDPSYLLNMVEDEPPLFGMEELQSSLTALQESQKASLRSIGLSEVEIANFHDSAGSQASQENFLSSVSQLLSPMEPAWRKALRYLGYVWSLISSLITGIIIMNTVRQLTKAVHRQPNNPVIEAGDDAL